LKRILLVASEFPPGPGGIGHHAYSLAKELIKIKEVQLKVLCNGDYVDSEKIQEFDKDSEFEIVRFKRIGKLTQVVRLIQFLWVCRHTKPEVIVYTGQFSLWLMNLPVLSQGVKKVVIIHGHEPIFGSRLKQWITISSFKKAHSFIAVSRFSKLTLLSKYRLAKYQQVEIIPNGIDPDYLRSWHELIHEKDILLNLKTGFPRLLTIGHTSPRKGQHNVINSLPEIKKNHPEVIYYIVGRDVRNGELLALAKKLGVLDNIQFIPPTEEHFQLLNFYQQADIFMLLSENQPNGDIEGFGIVALEANYFGIPVIGSKGCGVEDAVQDGFSGYLVENKDVQEISNRVNDILSNSDLFSRNTKEFAKRYQWDEIIKEYELILCAE
jgi:phosphatidylinositol alpha-1,6-mannosyltransferase